MTFDELITEMDSGQVNSDVTREMRDLVASLNQRAQRGGSAKGEITVKFKFAAANNGRVEVKCETTVKRPGPPKAEETRWIGDGGELLASDPRQSTLPLKVAGANDATIKTPRGG